MRGILLLLLKHVIKIENRWLLPRVATKSLRSEIVAIIRIKIIILIKLLAYIPIYYRPEIEKDCGVL